MNGWKRWNGDYILKQLNKELFLSVVDTLNVVLSVSKSEVPLDEGYLMRTGFIKAFYRGKKIIGIISYGGGAGTGFPQIPYAIRWHENKANFQHGRKWKYLVHPWNRLCPKTLENIIRVRVRKIL
jgi:hypothetical protein